MKNQLQTRGILTDPRGTPIWDGCSEDALFREHE